jgi:transposase
MKRKLTGAMRQQLSPRMKFDLVFFCMRSKYSGKHFVRFYPCERQQAFFDGHIQAFAFFGGIFPVLIYDNLTTEEPLFRTKQLCRVQDESAAPI